MTQDPSHAPDAAVAAAEPAVAAHDAHATAGHDANAEAHEQGEELGPIDWPNWAAGALGVAIALAMTVCFVVATLGLGAY